MIEKIRRVVLKIGSSSLNHPSGGLNDQAIIAVVKLIATLKSSGVECIVVTSGAVAAGIGILKLSSRPKDVAGKQALAAVGQGLLIEKYTQELEKFNIIGAQVLLSRMDLAEVSRYRNAQNTLERLLRLEAVPIINENDTVAVEELCFGDNDRLSALVAGIVHADLLIVFTDVDGLYTSNPKTDPEATLIKEVNDIAQVQAMASGAGSILGTGGMITKLKAANIATRFGIGMLLLNFNHISELPLIIEKKFSQGTYFTPVTHRLIGKKKWIAYAGITEGSIMVDEGAVKALVQEGKSLLARGIIGFDGEWERKDIVKIVNPQGREIARGIAELSKIEVDRVKGLRSDEMLNLIPHLDGEEVIHRDNLTLTGEPW